MTVIKLYDTGYASKTRQGNTSTNANRAGYDSVSNTVRAFTLNVVDMNYSGGANILNREELKQSELLSDTAPITFKNPTWSLQCQVKKSLPDDTGNYAKNWLYQFMRMERTKTIKLLYVDVENTGNTQYKTALEYVGEGNINGVFGPDSGTTVPYLAGYVSIDHFKEDTTNDIYNFGISFVLNDSNVLN